MAQAYPIEIEEISGDQFADLHTAQRTARAMLAVDLTQLIQQLIEQGALEIKDNQIMPKGK